MGASALNKVCFCTLAKRDVRLIQSLIADAINMQNIRFKQMPPVNRLCQQRRWRGMAGRPMAKGSPGQGWEREACEWTKKNPVAPRLQTGP
jgi:hypothetical protein